MILVGLAVFGYWVVARTGSEPEREADRIDEWYREAMTLSRDVQAVTQDWGRGKDAERVQRRLMVVSERLRGHARTAPEGVNGRLVREVYDLGVGCYRIGMEHTTPGTARSGQFLEDELDDLEGRAKRLEDSVCARRERDCDREPTTQS